jgi:prepilin-type N-terminal cleavage/methylation domain-containing protein
MLKERAFTLFEVMMAMGIFGIAVVGMMMALNSGLDAAADARREQAVRAEMENRMAALETRAAGEYEHSMEVKSPPMVITESLRPERVTASDRAVLEGFWRATVVAKWKEGGAERVMQSSFLRYGR